MTNLLSALEAFKRASEAADALTAEREKQRGEFEAFFGGDQWSEGEIIRLGSRSDAEIEEMKKNLWDRPIERMARK